jgi:radical SAM protein with 4Fe4S-binding SPASM domain
MLIRKKITDSIKKYIPKEYYYNYYILKRYYQDRLNLDNNANINNIRRYIRHKLNNIVLEPSYQKQASPKGALIEINNTCNLNCAMCNTQLAKRKRGLMAPEVFALALEQLSSVGIKSVGLHTVGEPFMYKNIEILLQIAQDKNINIWLSTNGQFPQKIRQVYNNFPAISYRFSIDGAQKTTYEHIRQGANFEKLIESLETIREINKNKRDFNILIEVGSIISMENIYELPLFFSTYGKYCFPHKINFHILDGLSPDKKYFQSSFPFPNLIRHMVPCDMIFESIAITYSGKVTLCCRDYEEELVVGDIKDNKLSTIWNSQEADLIRRKHINKEKLDISACQSCYGPHRFVSDIINKYIHFLRLSQANLCSELFGKKVIDLLHNMDRYIKDDLSKFNQVIVEAFNIN